MNVYVCLNCGSALEYSPLVVKCPSCDWIELGKGDLDG